MHALTTRACRARSATRRGLVGLAVTAVLFSGCSATKDAADDAMGAAGVGDDDSTTATTDTTDNAPVAKPKLKTSVKKGATGVPVDTVLSVKAKDATLTKVKVTQAAGETGLTLAVKTTAWPKTVGLVEELRVVALLEALTT